MKRTTTQRSPYLPAASSIGGLITHQKRIDSRISPSTAKIQGKLRGSGGNIYVGADAGGCE